MSKRINKVVIVRMIDESADLSYLGEYSDTPGKCAIDRQKLGSMDHDEYRYFNPANHLSAKEWGHVTAKEKAKVIAEHGSITNCNAHYRMEDYKRYEAYNAGEWCMYGIRAEAHVATSRGRTWKSDKLMSMGIWGIESDSGPDYLTEQGNEQLDDLRETLEEFGFTTEQIDEAFSSVETVDGRANNQFLMTDD